MPQITIVFFPVYHLYLWFMQEIVTKPANDSTTIIGQSPKFVAALNIARRAARSNANIFISGECGAGKEVFANFIHNNSLRAAGPFIAFNCAAIPESLLESELFGHAKGAFTGAQDKKIGLFEEAHEGTLFLDEIGDLSLSLQAKLLRVIQEKQIKRLGENHFRTINARIISATHKNILQEVLADRFREDLFYRLNVVPLAIPALRDRPEDIIPLAEAFLARFAFENQSIARSFSSDAINYLLENQWKGNVRELENTIERAVVLATDYELRAIDLITPMADTQCNHNDEFQAKGTHRFILDFKDHLPSLDETIQKYIDFAVSFNGGAKDRTAKEIGIDRKTLYKRLRQES